MLRTCLAAIAENSDGSNSVRTSGTKLTDLRRRDLTATSAPAPDWSVGAPMRDTDHDAHLARCRLLLQSPHSRLWVTARNRPRSTPVVCPADAPLWTDGQIAQGRCAIDRLVTRLGAWLLQGRLQGHQGSPTSPLCAAPLSNEATAATYRQQTWLPTELIGQIFEGGTRVVVPPRPTGPPGVTWQEAAPAALWRSPAPRTFDTGGCRRWQPIGKHPSAISADTPRAGARWVGDGTPSRRIWERGGREDSAR